MLQSGAGYKFVRLAVDVLGRGPKRQRGPVDGGGLGLSAGTVTILHRGGRTEASLGGAFDRIWYEIRSTEEETAIIAFSLDRLGG